MRPWPLSQGSRRESDVAPQFPLSAMRVRGPDLLAGQDSRRIGIPAIEIESPGKLGDGIETASAGQYAGRMDATDVSDRLNAPLELGQITDGGYRKHHQIRAFLPDSSSQSILGGIGAEALDLPAIQLERFSDKAEPEIVSTGGTTTDDHLLSVYRIGGGTAFEKLTNQQPL